MSRNGTLCQTIVWWCHSSLPVGMQGGSEERIRDSQASRASCRTRGTHGFLFLQQCRRCCEGGPKTGSGKEGPDLGLVSDLPEGYLLMAGMYTMEMEPRGLSGMIPMYCTSLSIGMMGVISTLQAILER